jgi:sugar phosphate isomerase/epimerase
MRYTRREIGKMALAAIPLAKLVETDLWAAINSRIHGVQIGAITYSFRTMPNPEDIIKAMAQIGLSEVELMSGDAEKLAGIPPLPSFGRGGGARAGAPPAAASPASPGNAPAPPAGARGGGGRGTPLTPEQQAEMDAAQAAQRQWRMSRTADAFKIAKKKFNDVGIDVRLLTYNMNVNTTKDDEIEYAFTMAKGLDVKAMTTSTQVSMAKRVAPFAAKHKMHVGFHGHDQVERVDEVASEATFKEVMAAGEYLCCNLDIGHYTAANGDPVAFIKQYHDRITNLHLKDRKKDHGLNLPWGQGDTPIKEVLQLLKTTKWDLPANIEYEYMGTDATAEVAKCYDYCKQALA